MKDRFLKKLIVNNNVVATNNVFSESLQDFLIKHWDNTTLSQSEKDYVYQTLEELAEEINEGSTTTPVNYVTVEITDNALTNGVNLLTAYENAKLLTPNGEALSANNRASVIVPPGVYDLGDNSNEDYAPLLLDTEFVDIIGLTSVASAQVIKGIPPATNSGVIVQTANDVKIANLQIRIGDILTIEDEWNFSYNDSTSAAYFPETNLNNTLLENIEIYGNDYNSGTLGWGTRSEITYSGRFIGVKGINSTCLFATLSTGTNCTGTFDKCESGNFSFAQVGIASGSFTDCSAGTDSFGTDGTCSGTFIRCIAGLHSFGGVTELIPPNLSGTLYNCILTEGEFTSLSEGGKLRACIDDSGFIAERDYVAP